MTSLASRRIVVSAAVVQMATTELGLIAASAPPRTSTSPTTRAPGAARSGRKLEWRAESGVEQRAELNRRHGHTDHGPEPDSGEREC